MRKKVMLLVTVLAFSLVAGIASIAAQQQAAPPPPSKFKLMSSAYMEGSMIPTQFSCADPNAASPALSWTNPPNNTMSFAVIMHDTDAAHEGSDGCYALDFLGHPGQLDFGCGRDQAGFLARRHHAGLECPQSEWIPAALPASWRESASLYFRNLRAGCEA